MRLSTRKDIDAPADYVFARISNFDVIERQAMRRGIEVERKSTSQSNEVGAGWTLKVPFRGKLRNLTAEVVRLDAPNEMLVNAVSGGLDMEILTELVALSRTRTRIVVKYDVKSTSLSARILLQSVKFAKGTLERRFERRVAKYCETLSEDYAKSAST